MKPSPRDKNLLPAVLAPVRTTPNHHATMGQADAEESPYVYPGYHRVTLPLQRFRVKTAVGAGRRVKPSPRDKNLLPAVLAPVRTTPNHHATMGQADAEESPYVYPGYHRVTLPLPCVLWRRELGTA